MKKTEDTLQIRDHLGRIITLCKPSGGDKLNLLALVGDNALNVNYMALCNVLLHIKKIDLLEVSRFKSLTDLENLYDVLGDGAVPYVTAALEKYYAPIH